MINKNVFGTHRRCLCKTPEKIENYDKAIADTTQTWECHHRNEKYFPRETLVAIGWYYDCRPDELIFLTKTEHMKLHHKGKKVSYGSKWYNNGIEEKYCKNNDIIPEGFVKGRLPYECWSEERKKSYAEKHSSWTGDRKKQGEISRRLQTGRLAYTNGIKNTWLRPGQDIPEGYYQGWVNTSTQLKSEEEKAEIIKKGWETRRKNKEKWQKK